ncbi:alpha-ketoglutarate dehydrogenase [Salinisphaera sp. T31B1]|uniref:alpha-ketoglutarate dehydrogenase n=1 Tax=Salinisphaera sp. T31B1 TaxID=727963 RepID=UPI0033402263
MADRSNPQSSAASADEAADIDALETDEWLDALAGVLANDGPERVRFLLRRLTAAARDEGISPDAAPYSAYRNTIGVERQGHYPGDLAIEMRLTAIQRWNALAMVVRANKAFGELGGHIASYAAAAELFEVGFNHFFKGVDAPGGGDLVYFQPHSAPGVYARAYLEGRLSEDELAHFRQETGGHGLSSYPHPWLMPEFWQFPTGSMGIGPINAVYQARFMRYLAARGLAEPGERHVWGIFGDGEMDEPESIGGLTLAAREGLDNLTFVVNCNLQRLDGPVRGNGQIIPELESLFRGAGWNVIKVLWGSDWDALFARDTHHALLRAFAATVDGKYQTLGANDGSYNLVHFFNQDPELAALVEHMTDAEIDGLTRGGHDLRKLHAAFATARTHTGAPTVILAKTKKGFGMGGAGESRMTAHQTKKLDLEALRAFRERFELPLSDDDLAELRFYKPAEDSAEMRYLRTRRDALGGALPARRTQAETVPVPELADYAGFALEADGKPMSTTMALVRLIRGLLRDRTLGPRLVPIVADEARTFGLDSLFGQIGIYSPVGQRYEPEDAGSVLYYNESQDGQILEEGITEAGALSSWIAAGTSYSVHGLAMLPFYIYYSMFGFQRVGDLIWAAADQRTRGFLVGGTAGRTTLSGEGLQHQDGFSHVVAAGVPNCRAYDPGFAYELAVIVDHGMQRMLVDQADEFYYLTVMNAKDEQPSMPPGVEDDIIRGLYRFDTAFAESPRARVRLVGSGSILHEVRAAAALLAADWQITTEIWSATSFAELARQAREIERWNRHHPDQAQRVSHVAGCFDDATPVIAATDYVQAYPQLIAAYIGSPYSTLGTDGFGRSDTRAAVRRFFEVDRYQIVLSALSALAREGTIDPVLPGQAIAGYRIDTDTPAPWMS